jgi:histidine ammonia-lyase
VTALLASREDVDLDVFRRVAWEGEGVELAPAALNRMAARRASFEAFVAAAGDRRLYGITTAHHRGATRLLSAEARAEYARRIPPTPASFGAPLPERLVRGIVLARIAGFLSGDAAVRPDLAVAVASMLTGTMPEVAAGGRGEAGEIGTLRAVFGHLEDELVLATKEGMALVNGAPAAAAVLGDIALAGRSRLAIAEETLALALDAARAPSEHLDPALEQAWRDPYEAAALQRLRALLEGGEERSGHQAAVAFRDAPRALGWVSRVQRWTEECATISLSAPGDNPIFASGDAAGRPPRVISNAGYHDARAAPMLNAVAAAWADLASLAAVQATRLAEDPAGLSAQEPEPRVTLLSMTALGWAEEARLAAAPTFISLGGSAPSDTSSPALLAWRRAEETGACLQGVLAVLGVLAGHTLAAQDRVAPPPLRPRWEEIMARFPPGVPAAGYAPALAAVADGVERRVHSASV